MSDRNTVRHRPGIDPQPVGRTDWARVEAMSDAEIEANALSDPDAQPFTDEELRDAFRPHELRALRERLGLTREEFAERFGLDAGDLAGWEEFRDVPDRTARSYLRVIARNPEMVAAALAAA